jgi:hypothetical protein
MVKTTVLSGFKIIDVIVVEWDYYCNRPIRYIGLFTVLF